MFTLAKFPAENVTIMRCDNAALLSLATIHNQKLFYLCCVGHLKEKVSLSAETVSPIGLNLVLITLVWLLRPGKDQDITDSGMQGNCGTLGQVRLGHVTSRHVTSRYVRSGQVRVRLDLVRLS